MSTAVATLASRLPMHGYCNGHASRSTTHAWVLQWPREPVNYRRMGSASIKRGGPCVLDPSTALVRP
ncbi:MAG: hypothetical protein M3O46_03210, partial [Myxococcota bacterium]|nr:hypothetical protein [Myxococcota bacterium]